jgi:hypothetical protein
MLNLGMKKALALAGGAGLALGFASGALAQYEEAGVVELHSWSVAEPGANYGWAVADMADIDGDGVRESIIGAPFSNQFGAGLGFVEVRSSASGAVLYTLPGVAFNRMGYSIAEAGDVDGDGVADILGAGPGSGGRVMVWSGATGGVLHNIAGLGGALGVACSGAGDINSDGHDDFMAGAAFQPDMSGGLGRTYVFSGADGSIMRTYSPPANTANFGWSMSLTDDLDGDGVQDHFIGAPGSGEAFAYSGATGALIHYVNGPQTNGAYGQFFVAGINDADGDGVGDLYVGDFADRANASGARGALGAAYVYSGATGEEIHHFKGKGQTTGLGPGRFAGDVDGDGYEDLAIGAWTASNGATNSGRLILFSGRDGSVLRTITSLNAGETLGFDAVGIGDVNGDGAGDYLVSGATLNRVAIIAGRPETCAGDLNRDGVIDSADASILTDAYEQDYKPGDLDGDGDVDNDDLHELLIRFGPCS